MFQSLEQQTDLSLCVTPSDNVVQRTVDSPSIKEICEVLLALTFNGRVRTPRLTDVQ